MRDRALRTTDRVSRSFFKLAALLRGCSLALIEFAWTLRTYIQLRCEWIEWYRDDWLSFSACRSARIDI